MKKSKSLLYLFFLVLVSCKPTSETTVTPLKQVNNLPDKGIIYALPKTTLRFTVEAKRTEIIPGPYAEFSLKYLGIENAPTDEETQWQISNIAIDSYNEIDPENYYVLEPSGKFNFDFLKLVQAALILPVNSNTSENLTNDFFGDTDPGDEIVFTDLSVKQYVGNEDVTYYKRVQRDSVFARVPVVKKQYVQKSFEDKAEEASNFIFMIRAKRFELISGMADFYPEGKSLEVAIKRLDNLEDEYMSLFIGKRFTSTYNAVFEFTPTEQDLTQPYILFRFSDDKGILQPNDLRGKPILVEMEKTNLTKNLSYVVNGLNKAGSNYKDKLYYRFPDKAIIRLIDGNKKIADKKVSIQQFGIVTTIPTSFLMDDETFIEFYPGKD
ncbi:MAG: DUF4831 family protein [Bacteroidales bacterium]